MPTIDNEGITFDSTAFTMDSTANALLVQSIAAGTDTGSTVTTGALTTTPGDTFYVSMVIVSASAVTVSDSKGNAYAQIGTALNDGSGHYLWRFYSTTYLGGSGHTWTGGIASGSAAIELFAGDLFGVGAVDNSNTNTSSAAPPTSSGAVTTTSANDLALSTYSTEYANASITFTVGGGFSIAQSQTNGTGGIPAAAFGSQICGGPGSYSAPWSDGSTGGPQAAAIDTFLAAVPTTANNQSFMLLGMG